MKRIYVKRRELIYWPLGWQKAGKLETASGYGAKLHTVYKLLYKKRLHRVYCCCYSNAGTCYINVKGERLIVEIED